MSWLLCRMMENKVAEAMSKKETLKARALTAETTKQLNESITSMVSASVQHGTPRLACWHHCDSCKLYATRCQVHMSYQSVTNLSSYFCLLTTSLVQYI